MLSQLQAMQQMVNQKKGDPRDSGKLFQHKSTSTGETRKKGDPRDSGRLFQHKSTSTGETRKKGRQFTLLRRITNSKGVNSDIDLLSIVSLERLSPKGFCQLDVYSRNDTLAQKQLIELLMWNASYVQKHSS